MENLDQLGFKFKVGEIVEHRLKTKDTYRSETISKTPLLIIERIATECNGGVQLFYMCRMGIANSGLSAITFAPEKAYQLTEIELEGQ